jgi:hypothetical protein
MIAATRGLLTSKSMAYVICSVGKAPLGPAFAALDSA